MTSNQPLEIVWNQIMANAAKWLLVISLVLAVTQSGAPQIQDDIAPAPLRLVRFYEGPSGDEFYNVAASAVDRGGRAIWLKHGGHDGVVRIDRKTGEVRLVGRRGSGPGEFRSINNIVAGAGSQVIVYDQANYRVTHLAVDGNLLGSWTLLNSQALPYGSLLGDAAGRLYRIEDIAAGTPSTFQPARDFAYTMPVRVDSTGRSDPIALPIAGPASLQWRATLPNGTTTGTSWGGHVVKWTIDAAGHIVAAWSDSSFVIVTETEVVRRLQFPAIPDELPSFFRTAVEGGANAFETRVKAAGGRFDNQRPPFPRRRDQVAALYATIDGGIAIVRNRNCVNVTAWRDPMSGRQARATQLTCPIVEHFDAAGSRLIPFSLEEPINGQLIDVRADTVWMTVKYPESDSARAGFVRVGEFVVARR